jgi:hypothetical protein
MAKFRSSESSSIGASSGTLLPDLATNAWAVGASADVVSIFSTLGGVVWTMCSTADALSPRMVKISWRFWSRRLPCMRRPLRRCRPTTNQAGKLDSLEYQTGPSSFPKDSRSSRETAQAIGAKIGGCSEFGAVRIRKGQRVKRWPMTMK